MLLKQSDWDQFYGWMKRQTGLDLYLYKPQQLQRRTISMMESQGCKSMDEFQAMILKQPDGVNWFLDKMAINVSELFRNPEKWVEIEKVILPNLLKENRNLRIWSAGCSIGAEAHSFACLLEDKFPGNHRIIGTDIDQAALAQAKSGTYSETDMRCVPPAYRAKYFTKTGDSYVANPELKRYLEFRKGDLLGGKFETGFDLIACRNVVIYFTEPAKEALYEKFVNSLRPGGILWVGSTERIFNYRELGLESNLTFFYQKPTGGNAWRNAS